MCKTCGVNHRLRLFSLWSGTHSFVLRMSCTTLISPLGRSYFWMFYGAKLLFLCPWSLSHREIALGIGTALQEADGDLHTDLFEVCQLV